MVLESSVFKMFFVHAQTQTSSVLKSVSVKPCFNAGLVWTVDLSVEIKPDFQISQE